MNRQENPGEGLLKSLTAFYLALPVLLFMAGWLRWEISCPIVLLALGGLWSGFFSGAGFGRGWRDLSPTVAICVLVLFVVWISGAGGGFCQRVDWLKHNSMLFDLVHRPWPVFYEGPSEAVPLIYYVGYYLPAALVGKFLGMEGAFAALFVWTVMGLLLVSAWLKELVKGRCLFWVFLAFLLFSGLDVVGNTIYHLVGRYFLHQDSYPWYRGEGWSGLLQYTSHLNWVFWVPQHALSCWLFTALLLDGSDRKPSSLMASILFCGGYSILWSPFVSLGLVPIILAKTVELKAVRDIRQIFSLHGLAAAVVGAVSLLFFLAKMGPSPYSLYAIQAGLVFTLPADSGNISVPPMVGVSPMVVVLRVLLFIFLEAGIFAFPLWILLRKEAGRKRLLLAAMIWLVLLPWFYYGLFNDFVMRASGSALFVLAVLGLQELFSRSPWTRARWLLAALWLVGSLSPLLTLIRQVEMGVRAWPGNEALQSKVSLEKSMLHAKDGGFFNTFYSAQYIGRSDSFFFRFLAKSRTRPE